MSIIRVLGIDRDGDSRLLLIEYLSPRDLARELHSSDWKQATLVRGDLIIGGVQLSARSRQRVWWADND